MKKEYTSGSRKILNWAEEDRPREKMLQKGRNALTDAELLAILLGSGTVSESAVDVAKKLLSGVNNNLHELARLSVADLMKVRGIGTAKAITLIAALELGRRKRDETARRRNPITSSLQVYEEIRQYLQDQPHEEFWVLLLNRSNEVIRPVQISKGGISGTVVDARIVFKQALDQLASSVILIHNHPSGALKPSEADRAITRQLVEAGKLLSIPILDHLIFSDLGYFSFADEGIL